MSRQWKVGAVFSVIVLVGIILNGVYPPLGIVLVAAGFVGILVWVRRKYRKERPTPSWPPPEEPDDDPTRPPGSSGR